MQTYLIHDNGGRPFKVTVEEQKRDATVRYSVQIFKKSSKDSEEDETYSKLVANALAREVYVGKSSGTSEACDHGKKQARLFDGNTLLLQLNGGDYIFIGEFIYSFSLVDGDEVDAYYSPVGNNDVPYPVLLGKKNVYFMLDKRYVPRSEFPKDQTWEDAYRSFYGNFTPEHGWVSHLDRHKKRFHSKQIHKRIV